MRFRRRKREFDEFLAMHQQDKADRAGQLFGERDEGFGGGAGDPLGSPDAATRVEGLTGDDLPVMCISTRSETAEAPSKSDVREALRRAAAAAVEGLAAVPAPTSNTGHRFTLHWADLTVFTTIETLADLVAMAFFDDYSPFGESGLDRFENIGPVRNYGRLLRGPGGIVLKCDSIGLGASHCRVELSGSVFDQFGMGRFARLIESLENGGHRWHATRLDCAFDHVGFTPRKLYESIKAGDVRSLADRESVQWHETPFGENAGGTCQFGKRESGHFIRCYDKRGHTRLEYQIGKDRAKWLGLYLVNAPMEKWGQICLGALRNFFDVVKRDSSVNVTRCKLSRYWRRFVEGVDRLKLKLSDGLDALRARAADVEGSVKHAARGIVRRAAKLYLVAGPEVFMEMVKQAAAKLGPVDLAQVNDWKMAVGEFSDVFGVSSESMLRLALDSVVASEASVKT